MVRRSTTIMQMRRRVATLMVWVVLLHCIWWRILPVMSVRRNRWHVLESSGVLVGMEFLGHHTGMLLVHIHINVLYFRSW
jgi:hypothetical protein